MSYQIPYAGELRWLVDRTILFTLFGSRAYGTDRPESDWDYRGICVPPQMYRDGYLHNFKQTDDLGDEADGTIYDIQKFFRLAADCNPSIMEVLFVDEQDVLHSTEAGDYLRSIREKFLSRKALYTFRGYAVSQLKKLKRHRDYYLNPPKSPPSRGVFGLPDQPSIPKVHLGILERAIREKMDSWKLDFGPLGEPEKISLLEQVEGYLVDLQIGHNERWRSAATLVGVEGDLMEILEKERAYKKALRDWKHYRDWLVQRNPKRAEMERKFGYDGKNALHLVRLLLMCREILEEGKVLVRRPDAEFLKSLLGGAWSYEELIEWVDKQDGEIREAAKKSNLPNRPPLEELDRACCKIISLVENG